jgi:hypothetical protein
MTSRTAKEHKSKDKIDNPSPRKWKLTEEEIDRVHDIFIKTGGHVRETARHTGFGKSTVSRYARAKDWYEELSQMDESGELHSHISAFKETQARVLCSEEGKKEDFAGRSDGDEVQEGTTAKLIKMRHLLFDEIMGDENSEVISKDSLKITPRTLSEAVKALIDVDKRISEREGDQPDTVLDPYQMIIARCAKIV